MKRNMKKALLVVLAALMSLTVLFGLVACGPSDEQVIRDGYKEELEKFKDPTSDTWSDISNTGEFAEMGLTETEVISAWVEGFDYSIDSVTINGNTAEVKITITCKQMYPVLNAVIDDLTNDESLAGLSQDEIMKKAGQAFIQGFKAASTTTTQVTVPCTKIGNTWTESASASYEYEKAFLGPE